MGANWSREMGCWTWSCILGCFGFDFEGEQEANESFLAHECPVS